MPPKVLIAFKGDVQKAPRVYRFLSFCREKNYVIDIACASVNQEEFEEINSFASITNIELDRPIRIFLKLLRFMSPLSFLNEKINRTLYNLSALVDLIKNNKYDLIYVADLYLLPVIIKYKKGTNILFDAREYYPLQYEDNINFKLFEKNECIRILKAYLKSCDKVITVSEGLAQAYYDNFNVLPDVILSLPNYHDEEIRNHSEETVKILYHGMANRNRRIENFIHILDLLKIKAELHLYLVGDKNYIEELKDVSKSNSKIHFRDPIPFEDIIRTINQFDVGICYYEPTSFNIMHCLPNKFFEYIQARLVVAIGPSPAMEKIVREHDCGVVSDFFTIESMADALNTLTRAKINFLKGNSDSAAKYLCFENEEKRLSTIIADLLK